MEWIRQWLLGVTCASLIAALADGLMPKGAVRQVGRLVCALVILCAVLRPILRLELLETGRLMSDIEDEVEGRYLLLEQNSDQMLKTLIERECGAYIVDKAAGLDVECRVQVECIRSDADVWLPHSARIVGQMDGEQQKALTALIQSGLGIAPDRLMYTGGE